MQNSLFEQRLENLKTVLDSNSQAVLLTNEKNIGYFCGFFHSEGYLLVTENETVLFVDFRYYEAALKKSSGCRVVCFTKLFKDLISEFKNISVVNVFLRHPILRLKNIIVLKRLFRKIILSAFVTAVLIIRSKKSDVSRMNQKLKKLLKHRR